MNMNVSTKLGSNDHGASCSNSHVCLKLHGYWFTWLFAVVLHDSASKECKRKMGETYALNKKMSGKVGDEDLRGLRRKLEKDEEHEAESKIRIQRPKLN